MAWKAKHFVGVIVEDRPTARWSTRKCCRGIWRTRTGSHTGALLSLARSYLWAQTRGAAGGLVELPRPEARHGPAQESEGKKGMKSTVRKRREMSASLYLVGLAGSDAVLGRTVSSITGLGIH